MPDITAIILALLSTIVAALGMLLFKKASGIEAKKLLFSKPFIGGGTLFIAGTALFILALRLDELSVLFPVTSLTYVWVMLLAKKFLREKIGMWKLAAVALIVLGIVFAAA